MFRRRSTLQRRDHESGLVFPWRLPVGAPWSLLVALTLVAGAAVALGVLVRVRIGDPPLEEERRASLVVVPAGTGGWWERAVEAGPYPYRWNPAADPAYAAARARALREAGVGRTDYAPRLRESGFSRALPAGGGEAPLVLPPPPPSPRVAAPVAEREALLVARVVRAGEGPSLQVAALPLDAGRAGGASGRRFVLRYAADGRVVEVTPLTSERTAVDLVGWLGRARVAGHGGREGWLVVESAIGS